MNETKHHIGEVVAYQARPNCVLIGCKIITNYIEECKVEFAAGNHKIVAKRQLSVAPNWLVEEFRMMESNNYSI